jgi:GntR family transcriptional repressor for pyruvate dehydrogenase complex
MIDGGIARLAAKQLNDADLARLAAIVTVQKKLVSDPIGFRVSDLEFHRTIAESTGNPFMVRVSHSLYVLGTEYRRIASDRPGVLKQSRDDHVAIVKALTARDPDASAAAMETHIRNVHESTKAAMEKAK